MLVYMFDSKVSRLIDASLESNIGKSYYIDLVFTQSFPLYRQ